MRGILILSCKKCGCVNGIEQMSFGLVNSPKHLVEAGCPDCGAFIRNMPKDGIPRIWDFESKEAEMVQNVGINVLYYHIQNGKLSDDMFVAAIEEVHRRIDETRKQHMEFESQLSLFG